MFKEMTALYLRCGVETYGRLVACLIKWQVKGHEYNTYYSFNLLGVVSNLKDVPTIPSNECSQ